jgi:5'-methylthioadenosine phosphorylase
MRRIGIIGGSGFGEAFAEGGAETVSTEWGQASVRRTRLGDNQEIVFVARHGAGHRLPPHLINHRANIAALQSAGVIGVLATAAVGSLQADKKPGDYVVLNDFIDLTKGEVVTWSGAGRVQHTDMGQPYDAHLRTALLTAADAAPLAGTLHPRGTYICLSGPRYETRAEVRLLASWGGDVVGMTSAPEAILCRELGLPYAGVAIVTNYGCGLLNDAILSHAEVEAQMTQSRLGLLQWLTHTSRTLTTAP